MICLCGEGHKSILPNVYPSFWTSWRVWYQYTANLRVYQCRRASWPDTMSLQRTFWSGDVMRSRSAGRFPRWQLQCVGAGALPRQSAETMHFWHSKDSSLARRLQLSHPNLVTRSAWNVILNPRSPGINQERGPAGGGIAYLRLVVREKHVLQKCRISERN